ncbi:hypothetical protein EDB81DRAFT_500243 [Dactylonectria macrodidyma]|uniref:Uncharacterized protein n=1 Tax=Dactylonectria macrodidyma TaxID=307937 RepID=A0A9P9J4E9_9HYPO|nr:hypothetical protein EDB81DRAFT_500243 [Dactylonectria macrodidyma]
MQNVSEIHPCIHTNHSVVGMLLYYTDGHRECVGQFPLDWVAEHFILDQTDKLYIHFDWYMRGRVCVATVTVNTPKKTADIPWSGIAQTGTLEWRFFSQYPILFHEGEQLNPNPQVSCQES